MSKLEQKVEVLIAAHRKAQLTVAECIKEAVIVLSAVPASDGQAQKALDMLTAVAAAMEQAHD